MPSWAHLHVVNRIKVAIAALATSLPAEVLAIALAGRQATAGIS